MGDYRRIVTWVGAGLLLVGTAGCFETANRHSSPPPATSPPPAPRPTPVVTHAPQGPTAPARFVPPHVAQASPNAIGNQVRLEGAALYRGKYLYCDPGIRIESIAGGYSCPTCPAGYSYVRGGNYCRR